jgi:hypothetical protein
VAYFMRLAVSRSARCHLVMIGICVGAQSAVSLKY